ncbi:hypothetical protein NDN08_001972 [Rhodosorus marinus]|uniref:Anaphase-promoting complex subunit 4 WD40 domain-containing protein n=1 Tax=Rhodosorus marinus TaxID=101924 RepID=A0AAV8USC5_9RHOD|nr:hypothetical protein NDN08_001972 [Rhodosorus marinus]
MKIELKGRKKAGLRPVKGSKFGAVDEDEQDEESRRHAQAAALKEISSASGKGEASNLLAGPGFGADEQADDGDGDEEDELGKLRQSTKFKSFSAEYKRDQRRKPEEPEDEGDEDAGIGPHSPPENFDKEHEGATFVPAQDVAGKEDDGPDDSDDEDEPLEANQEQKVEEESIPVPVSHEARLSGKFKATVSAIAMDTAGNRFCTGSVDYSVKFWDFGSMNANLTSFTSMEPFGSFPIRSIEFSPTGGKILFAGGSKSARMYDRDGREILVCPHGDMYLHDMSNTKGHAAPLSCAVWQPIDAKTFATSAADGTIRIWDALTESKKHKKIIKLKNRRGKKVSPTAIAYSPDGRTILAGCDDGGLRLYDPGSFLPKTVEDVDDAHGPDVITTSISYSSDGMSALTRTLDDCLRLWDVRRFDSPLSTFDNLPNNSEQTRAAFSGDGKYFATGTSSTSTKKKEGEPGKLVIFDRSTLRAVKTIILEKDSGGVVGLYWHPTINQIVYGTTAGHVHVLYDPLLSSKGILRCISKLVKRKQQAFVDIGVGAIHTPNALPMFRDEHANHGRPINRKRQQEKMREDPILTKKPVMAGGPDAKAIAGSTMASFVARSKAKEEKGWLKEDPREALLKLDEKAKQFGYFTGGDNPRVLATKTLEEEQAEEAERLKKRMPAHRRKKEDA